jgi:hypothetical protein
MVCHRGGQRIAKARAADVEGVAAVAERIADAPGRRLLLMEDDQYFLGHFGPIQSKQQLIPVLKH